MEFGFTEEQEAFSFELQKKGVEKGSSTAGWPKKYGGLGYTAVEQGIQSSELAYWGVNWPSSVAAFNLVGPVILMLLRPLMK